MRVLTVTHYFGSHGGGIERVAQRLAGELASLGHDLYWLASDASPLTDPPHSIQAEAVRSWHWVERALGIPFPIPRPAGHAKISKAIGRCDAVLIHDCLYLSNIVAFLVAKRRRKPVLIVQHIGDVPYRNFWLRQVMKIANRVITRAMLSRADQVVFISELTARHFSNVRYRRAPAIAFNGLDSSIFCLQPEVPEGSSRSRLGFSATDKLVVFAGRFVEKKGLPVIRTIAKLRPQIQFALAGQGPIDPAEWKLPNVRMFGQLSDSRLADLYRAGDVLLLPSIGEGFPLVIQEALACGMRVVCGSDTAVADSRASRYITGADVVAGDDARTAMNFLYALDAELAKPSTVEDRADRASFAAEHYCWKYVSRTYEQLLQDILDASSSQVRGRAGRPSSEDTGTFFADA